MYCIEALVTLDDREPCRVVITALTLQRWAVSGITDWTEFANSVIGSVLHHGDKIKIERLRLV